MTISDVKIRKIYAEGKLRALVSITVDQALAIHDLKVIEGTDRLFIAMPSRKEKDGTFRDIVHPISAQIREELERMVLEAYYAAEQEAEASLAAETSVTAESESAV